MGKNDSDLRIAIVGDVLVAHRLCFNDQLQEIGDFLRAHNCVIGNLETVVRNDEGYPEAFPGGGHCFCRPECLSDLQRLGFNMFSTCNNHSMDYGHGGLLATINYLDCSGFAHSGTGRNLSEASKAAHYETPNGRIALISITSSFHDSYLAGPQNQEVSGRPGVAPLRHKALYSIPHEEYRTLVDIAKKSGINSYHEQAIKEGYLSVGEHFKFGSIEFVQSDGYSIDTRPLEEDLNRTADIIQDAKLDSDIVAVSIHSHQFCGDKSASPQFVELFARTCISKGADIVFCHGPHTLRGIETYKNGIIFYGLGDFFLQHEGLEYMPEEAYLKQGLTRSTCKGVQHLFLQRNQNGTRGLIADKNAWESVIVSIRVSDDDLVAELNPVTLMRNGRKGFKGLPYLSHDAGIIRRISALSEVYGTEILLTDKDTGIVKIRRQR